MTQSEQQRIIREMIEAVGHATQSLGVGRVIGQIFAFLYFSREPKSLSDLTTGLAISKGGASMGVRQLEQWGAVERVWIKGDRKDYYRANDSFGKIIRSAAMDLAGKRIEGSATIIHDAEKELTEKEATGCELSSEEEFIKERVEKLQAFQQKTRKMWDSVILKMLLK